MAHSKKNKEDFIDILRANGGNIQAACKHCHIGRRTIYEWRDKEEWIAEAIEDIREISVDNVETSLYKSAMEGNVTAQIFFLKTQGRSRGYIEKIDNTHTYLEPLKLEIIPPTMPKFLDEGEADKLIEE